MYITYKLIILLNIQYHITNSINITESAQKNKFILQDYKSNRCARCTSKAKAFVKKSLKFVQENEGLGEFLKSFNVSQCGMEESANYVASHVLDGLIIHDDLPDWHWGEYKVIRLLFLYIR